MPSHVSARGTVRLTPEPPHDQGGVLASEAETRGDGRPDWQVPCRVRNVVQVAVRVGVAIVDRGGKEAVAQGFEAARDLLDGDYVGGIAAMMRLLTASVPSGTTNYKEVLRFGALFADGFAEQPITNRPKSAR